MAERSKAPDLRSGPPMWAWVQIPFLTMYLFFLFLLSLSSIVIQQHYFLNQAFLLTSYGCITEAVHKRYHIVTKVHNKFIMDSCTILKLYMQKQPSCKKRCGLCKKTQHEKSCAIQGGSPEVVVMVG